MALNLVKQNKAFGGWVKQFSHTSKVLGDLEMKFSVFLPAQSENSKVPVVYYLSGLTCTDENFTTKAGAQRRAAELGFALVAPDTSPRGANIEGEDESYDFGSGAGFYVDATTDKWKKNYNMYSYVTDELPSLIASELPVDDSRKAVSGHSMGGHGSLITALKNPGMFKCATAFAPIANPMNCQWGQKAFTGYLGEDKSAWAKYDASELVKSYEGPQLPIFADQGLADNFYPDQLLSENFIEAAKTNDKVDVEFRFQEGYDHSYYTMATFIDDHLDFIAKHI
ncbi:S-formylglutathione hydrolase [Hondaea fermentalgiana]|uniref:S-formylglutathione hydrolase n=1 Tax=Hondaea fermentalgiana TaxID=2315210 RepID=A0A2R5GR02_9STRA|nr:S-formylglutathione hydrolase [Hondaea fermentalgiana]|eukprot:GBG33316.1 S-formylglutathione hydrolase [Hondaea fermentalgiana]